MSTKRNTRKSKLAILEPKSNPVGGTSAQGGGGAGKVAMQDFHFVMRNSSASPSL